MYGIEHNARIMLGIIELFLYLVIVQLILKSSEWSMDYLWTNGYPL